MLYLENCGVEFGGRVATAYASATSVILVGCLHLIATLLHEKHVFEVGQHAFGEAELLRRLGVLQEGRREFIQQNSRISPQES